jgi:nucleolar protein 56
MDIKSLREKNIELAKRLVKESVNADNMIINSINMSEEIDKTANSLMMRLRDWLCVINPELEKKVTSDEKLLNIIINEELEESSMGKVLDETDYKILKSLANKINEILNQKQELEEYSKNKLKSHAPNLLGLLGVNIASKLFKEAKSLRKLAFLQSGTIQLLGAEKALFRHLKTGARSPKYGIILNHPLVQESKNKGKTSRVLADKISIAARLDYFKGELMHEELYEQVKNCKK